MCKWRGCSQSFNTEEVQEGGRSTGNLTVHLHLILIISAEIFSHLLVFHSSSFPPASSSCFQQLKRQNFFSIQSKSLRSDVKCDSSVGHKHEIQGINMCLSACYESINAPSDVSSCPGLRHQSICLPLLNERGRTRPPVRHSARVSLTVLLSLMLTLQPQCRLELNGICISETRVQMCAVWECNCCSL